MQALRLWSRALANISRLSNREQTTVDIEPPVVFTAPPIDLQNPIVELPSRKRNTVALTSQNSGLVWSVAEVSRLSQLSMIDLTSLFLLTCICSPSSRSTSFD